MLEQAGDGPFAGLVNGGADRIEQVQVERVDRGDAQVEGFEQLDVLNQINITVEIFGHRVDVRSFRSHKAVKLSFFEINGPNWFRSSGSGARTLHRC